MSYSSPFTTLGAKAGSLTHVHGSSQLAAGAFLFFNPNTFYADWHKRTIGTSWPENSRTSINGSGGSWIDGSFNESNSTGIGIFGNTDATSTMPQYIVVNYEVVAG